jgi:twinkle protein
MKRPFVPADDLKAAVLDLHRDGGLQRGDLPGWGPLNRLYTVAPGQWTVVTGTPQSGKSELLDAMMVNLAESAGYRFAVYSPENWPVQTHVAKLAEKRARKPFTEGKNRPITASEIESVTDWVLEHFQFIQPEEQTPDFIIATANAWRPKSAGKYGVVLDPWNTLDHQRGGLSETDYISKTLTSVKSLVQMGNCHCWLVVHPSKLYRAKGDGKFPVPHPYDISGSSHWYNKADNILCVHRPDKADELSDGVEIHVQKVRFKHIGHIGLADLRWDRVTGRYFEAPDIIDITTRRPERYRDPESRYGSP